MMRQVAIVVDDQQPLRAYVSAVLRNGGFEVVEAADGRDALSLIRRMNGVIDVLVTDIRMPRMTGIELVSCVESDFPDIPVVYMSGEVPQKGLLNWRAGVLFLEKPFGPQAILKAVRTVVAPSGAAARAAG